MTGAIIIAPLALGTVAPAQAIVLTFDDLPSTFDPIPNGYGGLNWDKFYYLDSSNYVIPSGYFNGTVSPNNVAYNAFANPARVRSPRGTFDFEGAYLTGAWNNGLNITVDGYHNSTLLYSQTVTVDTTSPTWFTFNYDGINFLRFTSFGGINAGYGGGGAHFAMDNFTVDNFTVVPEPFTLLGVGTALGFGAAFKRKVNKKE